MNAAIAAARLRNQRIACPLGGGPAAVVAALGAVQAQEFEPAKWGLGLRMRDGTTDASIERAFTDGRILRTHVLRPTWHFVPRADIRWMLELTGPRVQRALASYHRRLGLESALLTRATGVIERALDTHGPLTRQELRGHLAKARIVVDSMRLAFIMTHAELTAVVCSGPRRDRQFTYALLAARAPDARTLPRDEALGTLTRRYFVSHGPATVRDFVWWSGLTTTDAKRGLEIVRARQASIDGYAYWTVGNRAASLSPRSRSGMTAHLLPIYDEYLVAYRDRAAVPHATLPRGSTVTFQHALVIEGQVAGTWRMKNLVMTITPVRRLTGRERKAARDAASRYEQFLQAAISVM
jgi:Winged helix DNA-binding domain